MGRGAASKATGIVGAAALLLAATWVQAEDTIIEFDASTARTFHGLTPTGPRRFESDGEAQGVVDRIVHFVPVRHKVTAFVTDDSTDVPNAEARIDKTGKRVIGFNRAFMQGLKKQTGNNEWAPVGIAAHELGHHAANHNFLPDNDCKLNNEVELEADYYAGFALGKMAVKLDDATSALRQLPTAADCTHPGRLQRIGVLKDGWQQATTSVVAELESTVRRAAAASVSTVRAAAQIDVGARFKLRKNRDIHGHDLERSPGVSFDQCALRCEKNAQCKGFSFDRWNGWCFLKDAMPGSLLDPASIIGVKANVDFPLVSKATFETHRLRGKRFNDKPNATTRAATYDDCQQQCTSSTDCVAYTYAKAGKTCQMFKETLGYFVDPRFDSGFKRQPPSGAIAGQRMETEKNKYFKGDGYQKHEDASAADCAALCLRDGQCKATEYIETERVCRLFRALEPALEATGTDVAFKR